MEDSGGVETRRELYGQAR